MSRSCLPVRSLTGAGLVLALFAAGAAVPAHAAPDAPRAAVTSEVPAASAPVLVDAGNGLTATVSPDRGNVLLRSSAGLAWDASVRSVDRYGLGGGVTWDAAFVDTHGGAFAYIPGAGVFAANPDVPSGLDGYHGTDVRFDAHDPERIPARGVIPARAAFFTLTHTSTGVTDYFGGGGDLLTSIDASGVRTDRVYDWNGRLVATVDANGVLSTVEYWSGEIVIGDGTQPATRLVQERGEVTEIVSPDGGRSTLTRAGDLDRRTLIGIASSAAGVRTDVQFAWDADVKRVSEVTRNGVIVYPTPQS